MTRYNEVTVKGGMVPTVPRPQNTDFRNFAVGTAAVNLSFGYAPNHTVGGVADPYGSPADATNPDYNGPGGWEDMEFGDVGRGKVYKIDFLHGANTGFGPGASGLLGDPTVVWFSDDKDDPTKSIPWYNLCHINPNVFPDFFSQSINAPITRNAFFLPLEPDGNPRVWTSATTDAFYTTTPDIGFPTESPSGFAKCLKKTDTTDQYFEGVPWGASDQYVMLRMSDEFAPFTVYRDPARGGDGTGGQNVIDNISPTFLGTQIGEVPIINWHFCYQFRVSSIYYTEDPGDGFIRQFTNPNFFNPSETPNLRSASRVVISQIYGTQWDPRVNQSPPVNGGFSKGWELGSIIFPNGGSTTTADVLASFDPLDAAAVEAAGWQFNSYDWIARDRMRFQVKYNPNTQVSDFTGFLNTIQGFGAIPSGRDTDPNSITYGQFTTPVTDPDTGGWLWEVAPISDAGIGNRQARSGIAAASEVTARARAVINKEQANQLAKAEAAVSRIFSNFF